MRGPQFGKPPSFTSFPSVAIHHASPIYRLPFTSGKPGLRKPRY